MTKEPTAGRAVAQNRKARHDYFIEETLEAGIQLLGTEVKSLRGGGASIAESHAGPRDGELYLWNAHIPEYAGAKHFSHEPRRARKLLVRRRELSKLIGAVQRAGITIVPLSIYFNERGMAKVQLGVAKGKRKIDKRETEKQRDWQREQARLMRNRGRPKD
ncbi:MAG: SsrA-binding protein SmpB [Dongiaceae bacterium]